MASQAVFAIAALLLLALYKLFLQPKSGPREARKPDEKEKASAPASLSIEPDTEFVLEKAEPRKLRPFKPVYHITMGVQADTPSELITIDTDYPSRILKRRSLIETQGSTVHGCTPHGTEAVHELYTYLTTTYLPQRFPTAFHLSDDKSTLRNDILDTSISTTPPADGTEAIRVLGQTVEEDLFLLRETPEGHESTAFMCCFPSGFDPSTKLGKLLKEIHKPVPSYEKIGPSMERFFAKLQVGKPVKRTNWSVQTHSDLFNCASNHINEEDDYTPDESNIDMSTTFLRIELQTLTRLPKTQAILFSFKTYMYSMKELKEEGSGPEVAAAIMGLKDGNAPGMWVYKGTVRWGKAVVEYLRS